MSAGDFCPLVPTTTLYSVALWLVRQRGDQRQRADLLGMIERERQRNRSAERMPDDHRPLQPAAT
jgi:hypothetical protein